MNNKILDNYFFILFSLIPMSIILGPTISLINIILIDISFIFLVLYQKNYKFLSDKSVKLIALICLYLFFNSLISKDSSIGLARNLGFIRFGILFCAFNYFFYNKKYFHKILIVWSIILTIVITDTYIESLFGLNSLGYGAEYGNRIVSFFKDEPIVGGYINAFYLIIIGYFFSFHKNYCEKYKIAFLIFSMFFVIAIFLTGERSNTIKSILIFLIFYSINDHFNLRQKIISILILIAIIGGIISNSHFLKMRFYGQFFKPVVEKYYLNNKSETIKENIYLTLYKSGFSVFKNYPIFGVGNKNYRIEACVNSSIETYVCNTHPHQIYFEFLAEHGLAGSAILLFALFNLIFGKLKIIFRTKNYVQLGCFLFLLTYFIPFLPSGAFFNDYSLTIFWINLSLMYSIEKKTNIFSPN